MRSFVLDCCGMGWGGGAGVDATGVAAGAGCGLGGGLAFPPPAGAFSDGRRPGSGLAAGEGLGWGVRSWCPPPGAGTDSCFGPGLTALTAGTGAPPHFRQRAPRTSLPQRLQTSRSPTLPYPFALTGLFFLVNPVLAICATACSRVGQGSPANRCHSKWRGDLACTDSM